MSSKSSRGSAVSKCPSCGRDNQCQAGSAEPCWCVASAAKGSGGDGESCLCPDCLAKKPKEEISIFDEDGALSREFLLSRGECCGNKCRNCPYNWINVQE